MYRSIEDTTLGTLMKYRDLTLASPNSVSEEEMVERFTRFFFYTSIYQYFNFKIYNL